LEQELKLEKKRFSNKQQRLEMKQSLSDIIIYVKQMNIDFKLNNQEKKSKGKFNFQRNMSEQLLSINDRFNDQFLRFQNEKHKQQMNMKYKSL
jgi:hypothetical protein